VIPCQLPDTASAGGHGFAVADAPAEVQPVQIEQTGYKTTAPSGQRWSAVHQAIEVNKNRIVFFVIDA
jgi:hypothetical protein